MIACLPMYDRPELRTATDQLWQAIATQLQAGGIDAPVALSRQADHTEMWNAPDLLLGMTCGAPYRQYLHQVTSLVGNIDYGLVKCPPGHYRSHVIVPVDAQFDRLEALRGSRFAYNGKCSESGFWCLERRLGTMETFCGAMTSTGAHQKSVEMVANAEADFAAIDATTWRYIEKSHVGLAGSVRIIASTAPTPGLPLITRYADLAPVLHAAVKSAFAKVPKVCSALGIAGLVKLEHKQFMALERDNTTNKRRNS